MFQWIGKGANKDEKFKAQQFAQQLSSDRNGKLKIEVLDEDSLSANHEFYNHLSNTEPEEEDKRNQALASHDKQLFKYFQGLFFLNCLALFIYICILKNIDLPRP